MKTAAALAAVLYSILVSRRGKVEGVEEAKGDPLREVVGRKRLRPRDPDIEEKIYRSSQHRTHTVDGSYKYPPARFAT